MLSLLMLILILVLIPNLLCYVMHYTKGMAASPGWGPDEGRCPSTQGLYVHASRLKSCIHGYMYMCSTYYLCAQMMSYIRAWEWRAMYYMYRGSPGTSTQTFLSMKLLSMRFGRIGLSISLGIGIGIGTTSIFIGTGTAKVRTKKFHTKKLLGRSPWGFPRKWGLSPLKHEKLAESNLLNKNA